MPRSLPHRLLGAAVLAFACAAASGPGAAAVLTAGTPVDSLPPGLVDPFFTLDDPLQPGQYLVPIQVTGAAGLVDWRFDLAFNPAAVVPLDLAGLYGSVYQTEFTPGGLVSEITSGGLALAGLLDDVAGFFFPDGAAGDGTLVFVLFELRDGASIDDGGFVVLPADPQPAPAPGSAALAAAALAGLAAARRRHPKARSATHPPLP